MENLIRPETSGSLIGEYGLGSFGTARVETLAILRGGFGNRSILSAQLCWCTHERSGLMCDIFNPNFPKRGMAIVLGVALFLTALSGCGSSDSNNSSPGNGSTGRDPQLQVTPTSLDFGPQTVGASLDLKAITLKNAGTSAITVESVTSDVGAFRWKGPGVPFALDPSQVALGQVTFTPSDEATYTGEVAIHSSVSSKPQLIRVTGQGWRKGAVYLAPSDLTVRPEPPLPSLGAAGFQFQDPSLGAWIVRATDSDTRPDKPGIAYGTPTSSEANAWNSDSTIFYVLDLDGSVLPYSFDPVNMAVARLGNAGSASGGLIVPLRPSPSFSFVDGDLLYGFPLTGAGVFGAYRFSTDSVTSVHDATTCVAGLSGTPEGLSISGDDARLTGVLRGSEEAAPNYIYVYDRNLGCRWYNTVTGEVGGRWGSVGRIKTDARFHLQDARISRDGAYISIETTSCSTVCKPYYIWALDTLEVQACIESQPVYCRTPQAIGYNHLINNGQVNDGVDLLKRSLGDPESFSYLIKPSLSPTQRELALSLSWNNARRDRLNPVMASTYRLDGNSAQRPWDNEVIAIRTDGVETRVWRFCHTRTTVSSDRMAPRGTVSQDGQFFAFTSNWEGSVGTERTDVFVVELRLSEPPPPGPNAQPPGAGGGIIWISPAELALRTTSGPAWNSLLSRANSTCGVPNLADQDDAANVCILAKALVFARTGEETYRSGVVSALQSIVNSATYNGRALALARELGAYVVSAELISLKTYDTTLDQQFRAKIQELLTTPTSGGPANLIECFEERANNWGTHCGGTVAAIAAYLGDTARLAQVARVFKGWLGDRSSYAEFVYGEDLSWQCDPSQPVGINPAGCMKDGHSIDGVLADDQRRGGEFTWPPPKENYVYEALQDVLLQAIILHRAGYDPFNWQDRAILRAYRWLHEQANYPAAGDDTWQPHVVNYFYGASFPAPVPSRPGKSFGWTDWVYGTAASE